MTTSQNKRYDKGHFRVNLHAAVLSTSFIPDEKGNKSKDKLRLFVKKSTDEVDQNGNRTEVAQVAMNVTLLGSLAHQASVLVPGDSICINNADIYQPVPQNQGQQPMTMIVASYQNGATIVLDRRSQHQRRDQGQQPSQQAAAPRQAAPQQQPQAQRAPAPQPAQAPVPQQDFDNFDDDIPF